jgi:L-fucose isomerase-like protein
MTTRRIGFVAIARPTFDVEYAQQVATAAREVLASLSDIEVVGSSRLALDADSLEAALTPLGGTVDAVVVLYASFADSTLVREVTQVGPAPIVLWAVPEPRSGGRLRLNSFCGINLAAYALRQAGRNYRFILCDPASADAADSLRETIHGDHGEAATASRPPMAVDAAARVTAERVVERLAKSTVGLIGERPDGFEPCDYDAATLSALAGVRVEEIGLPRLFSAAASSDAAERDRLRGRVSTALTGVDDLDDDGVDRSLELHLGMRHLADQHNWSAFATRCWPECFTEYGGAACTAMSLANSAGVPGCCEADVYGSVTSLILQELGGSPAFIADLVDLDFADDTGVLWHCGLAPLEMSAADPAPRATIHSNRAMPLLGEFALKPGRVTLARLSQSGNQQRLLIGGGEMLSRPPAFAGTSGVIRFDAPAADVFTTIMSEGLEHHYGLVYGDIRSELHGLAGELSVQVVALT